MKKVLFLIHDLGQGGAEKVLINLVNNMDASKFDITVMTLFDCGENRQFLSPKVKYKTWCKKMIPGNSHIMKLWTPKQLHKMIIKEHYDIEVAYLEGPCARIISGCQDKTTKLVSWIHCTLHNEKELADSFRTLQEAKNCYNGVDVVVFVSEEIKQAFIKVCPVQGKKMILYNTNQSEKIIEQSREEVNDIVFLKNTFYWCGVGKVVANKGFDRMLRIQKKFITEGYNTQLLILGMGKQQDELVQWCKTNNIENSVVFLGYQTNPYKYVSKCDLFVCASHSEGFSTAATEALIAGTPVCSVEVSGMKEMLGKCNEYGIVARNNEEALYNGIKRLLDNPDLLKHYKHQAKVRGEYFNTENTVEAVEAMLNSSKDNIV